MIYHKYFAKFVQRMTNTEMSITFIQSERFMKEIYFDENKIEYIEIFILAFFIINDKDLHVYTFFV